MSKPLNITGFKNNLSYCTHTFRDDGTCIYCGYMDKRYLAIQELVNMSYFLTKVHSAILYGLIEGELPNIEKCNFYIKKGKQLGIEPDEDFTMDIFTT